MIYNLFQLSTNLMSLITHLYFIHARVSIKYGRLEIYFLIVNISKTYLQ